MHAEEGQVTVAGSRTCGVISVRPGAECRVLRLIIWAGVVATCGGSAGCIAPNPAALRQLCEAERDYRNQDYRSANRKLDDFLAKYPSHADSAEAYCLRSLCHVQVSKKHLAERDARSCIRLSKDRSLTASASATLATILFEGNRNREAVQHYAVALRTLPEQAPTDLVRYRYGLCLQREGRWREAKTQFAAVYQRYPGSTLAQHAKRLYDWPHDAFSIQCGAYREKKAASQLEQKLRRHGHGSWTERRLKRGATLYTVYVGKYSGHQTARAALPAVRRIVSDAHVVP